MPHCQYIEFQVYSVINSRSFTFVAYRYFKGETVVIILLRFFCACIILFITFCNFIINYVPCRY